MHTVKLRKTLLRRELTKYAIVVAFGPVRAAMPQRLPAGFDRLLRVLACFCCDVDRK